VQALLVAAQAAMILMLAPVYADRSAGYRPVMESQIDASPFSYLLPDMFSMENLCQFSILSLFSTSQEWPLIPICAFCKKKQDTLRLLFNILTDCSQNLHLMARFAFRLGLLDGFPRNLTLL